MPYILVLLLLVTQISISQTFNHSDTLRGSINANRSWWDVTYYDLFVAANISKESIEGSNKIHFKVIGKGNVMQIDLQEPLVISNVRYNNADVKFTRDGNTYLISFPSSPIIGTIQVVEIYYKGKPRKAIRAPWDGGIVWEKDVKGRPFVNTACLGLGASVWWPCKDHQSDEPDSMLTTYVVPRNLVAVGNGRLRNVVSDQKGNKAYSWFVQNPINNYCITMNIGNYANFKDTFQGEKGKLDMSYWVLDYNLTKAKKQFIQAKQTIRAFEYWFGPYPFYEDSYKLIETHHLGMEHQSAVAYGNQFKNGYLGNDLSGSGWGKKWDFIIVHETGHEWFGNNITTNDIADMWVHEGFTNYSETLFTEYYYGKKAGEAYSKGIRNNIQNDIPIIGSYGVNNEGSGDMYYKGSNLIHTIRTLLNDDNKFRSILRGLNKDFYHQTVTTQQIENYINEKSGMDFTPLFDQYLRTKQIPVLEYTIDKKEKKWTYSFKFTNCPDNFTMRIPLTDKKLIKNNILISNKEFSYLEVYNKESIEQIINDNILIILKEIK